ncbi:hypothetical protein [Ignavibacterium album]|uniref:hypothetical protein n=1 Tax=Ignavibacterium album TaxID=591197 RepID=UPI0035B7CDBB
MKNSNKIVCIIIALLFVSTGCEKSDDTVIVPPLVQNLITNYSFESAEDPSIEGWTFRDSTIYSFYPGAPVGGGNYSVILRTVWRGPFSFNSLMTKVAIPVGAHRYRLSCWAKRLPYGAGFLALFVGSGNVDSMTTTIRIPITDTVWTFYSKDTVIINQDSDSIVVALHGGYSNIQYPDDLTFFDLCKFEKLD